MNSPMMIVGLVISIVAIVGLAIGTGMKKKKSGGIRRTLGCRLIRPSLP